MQAATVTINRRALRHNLQRPRELAPASRIVAVMRTNAYDYDLLETARTLPDADVLGIVRLERALRPRAGGVTGPILLLRGFFDARDPPTISAQHFHTAVHNKEQPAALEEVSLDELVTVQMKLDTDIHYLGVRPGQAEAFYHRLTQCRNVRQPMNIIGHFARADGPKYGATGKQLVIFSIFYEGKPGQRSIVASGDILLWLQSHFDWVRLGIILYGVSSPEDRFIGADFDYQPVLPLTFSLVTVHEHKAGGSVGYGGTWVSECDTHFGVVAVSYGDGYPHVTLSGTPVLVNGREVPIVGRAAMDMIYIDSGPQAQDKAGDPIILWGEGLSVECIAETTKVSAYELITCPTSRVAMEYVD